MTAPNAATAPYGLHPIKARNLAAQLSRGGFLTAGRRSKEGIRCHQHSPVEVRLHAQYPTGEEAVERITKASWFLREKGYTVTVSKGLPGTAYATRVRTGPPA